MPIRLFYYSIDNKMYYAVSNILDDHLLTLDDVKTSYHMRWRVEENIKLDKSKFKLGNLKDKQINNIEAKIQTITIYTKILQTICSFFNKNINYKINQSKLIKNMNDQNFLIRLFLKSKEELLTDDFISLFFNLCVKIIKIIFGRDFERISITPYTKWNIKQSSNKSKKKPIIA
jgi:hypothetical protein